MQVLAIVGPNADARQLDRVVGRLVDALADRGRTGVVRYDATIADGTADVRATDLTTRAAVTYDLGADGDWVAAGTGMDADDALDALAPDCEYAVVIGVDGGRHPTLVLGDTPEGLENVVGTVDSPANLDVERVVAALEDAEPYETLASLVARVKRSPRADRAGAIATFTGRVRAKDEPEDARTEYLEFEKYEGVADRRLAAIRTELEVRDGVHEVAMHHRTGVVRDGEDIVFVVVLAGHRAEAFRTVEDGINRLKDEVPLFKKEVTVEDTFWVHERE